MELPQNLLQPRTRPLIGNTQAQRFVRSFTVPSFERADFFAKVMQLRRHSIGALRKVGVFQL